jgi:PAS domain S-box-containing protein
VVDEDREAYQNQADLAFLSGEQRVVKFRCVTKSGEWIWAESHIAVIRDGSGNSIGLRGVTLDVTEREKAHQALLESEELFRNMSDAAPTFIWVADTEMLCTYFNTKVLDFTGRTMGELNGRGWLESIHPDDLDDSVATYANAYERLEPFIMEMRWRRADGEYRWIYNSGAPLVSSSGALLGYVGSAVDISERRLAEESLQTAMVEIKKLKDDLQEENMYLREVIELEHNFDEIIGNSDALRYVFFKIEQVAKTDATVLITGETGTGKELVARAIHSTSRRSSRPLVKVNCAALSAGLIESELFGHERGAFTGATARKIGRFELADGATIFLDEVGELPLELQSKLLRVIQEGEFERLGSSKTITVDARIIAATNRNLESEVKKGNFREDLLFRLNVFPITVPPLRERKDDLPQLIEYFANRFSKKIGKTIRSVSPGTIRNLAQHSWPGNIRELANVIERSVINSQGETLSVFEDFGKVAINGVSSASADTLETMERKYISEILANLGWRIEGVSGAARVLGLNPSTLRTRMAKLGITKRQAHDSDQT